MIESTPSFQSNEFNRIWDDAENIGFVRHFFPWWNCPEYTSFPISPKDQTKMEKKLSKEHGLTPKQIGFRRKKVEEFLAIDGPSGEQWFMVEYGEALSDQDAKNKIRDAR
jgi:hypothetical protein